ncbi:MAG: hypothetical protein F9K30_19970 [Dechloromonas sp.]|nr:MAG: hypothetical protein F9K30_19970 [Dechloromonas sp.]
MLDMAINDKIVTVCNDISSAGNFSSCVIGLAMLKKASDRTAFRERFIREVEAAGLTSAEISKATGVPKPLIDKLRQRRAEATNVDAAIRLARFFGMTVEEMAGTTAGNPEISEILALILRLSPEERALVLAQLEGVAARRRSR